MSFLINPYYFGGIPQDYFAYYTMANISGSTLIDESANSYDGTINDSPTTVTGQIGDALSFDGTNDSVTGFGSIGSETLGAMSFWMNPNGAVTAATGFEFVFGLFSTHGYVSTGNTAGAATDETMSIITFDGSSNARIRYIRDNISDIWNHFVLNWNGSNWDIYMNNVALTMYDASTGSPPAATQTIGQFKMATRTSGGFAQLELDEVRLYPNPLSLAQIESLYNE